MLDCCELGGFMFIQYLSDQALLEKIKQLVGEERKLNLEILHHLREVEDRKLFLARGYSSLFDYAVKELSYSQSAAYRRIQAMRLIKDLPEMEKKIAEGSINLTVVAQAQSFFKAEAKKNQAYSAAHKLKLLHQLENKSSREVEKVFVQLNPEIKAREKVRAISANQVELKIILDEKLKNQLNELRALLSHVNPNMSYQELIAYLAEVGLKKLDPRLREEKKRSQDNQRQATPAPEVKAKVKESLIKAERSRYISAELKSKIWKRDQGCCTYIDPKTKRKCASKYFIQIDHRIPFALGGPNIESNLRLLCAAHNQNRVFRES